MADQITKTEEKPKTRGVNIYGKILNVMAAVESVEKKGHNDFQHYDYATEADILRAIRAELITQGLVVAPTTLYERRDEDITTLHIAFRLIDAETGEQVDSTVVGTGQDKGDKGAYKAFTGANKYYLMKTFMLPTNDDPEKTDAAEKRPVGRPKKEQAYTAEDFGREINAKGEEPNTETVEQRLDRMTTRSGNERDIEESMNETMQEPPRSGAVIREVKKDGPNKGRKFWSDPDDPNFFQWAD